MVSHADVDAIWAFGSEPLSETVERLSASNLKRTFVDHGRLTDWHQPSAEGADWLRHATEVKNIWIPYGV